MIINITHLRNTIRIFLIFEYLYLKQNKKVCTTPKFKKYFMS